MQFNFFLSYKTHASADPNPLYPLEVRQHWLISRTGLNCSMYNISSKSYFRCSWFPYNTPPSTTKRSLVEPIDVSNLFELRCQVKTNNHYDTCEGLPIDGILFSHSLNPFPLYLHKTELSKPGIIRKVYCTSFSTYCAPYHVVRNGTTVPLVVPFVYYMYIIRPSNVLRAQTNFASFSKC